MVAAFQRGMGEGGLFKREGLPDLRLDPPAFQQPFGAPPIGPGAPGGPLQSPWTPPVAPPPSQTRDPGALPPAAFQALAGGKLFDRLEGFADRIGGWAEKGSRLLGKGMHFAELGMHGLSRIGSGT